MLARRFQDPHSVEDLLGQTFLEAVRNWDGYSGRGSREAWLVGIARNVARREGRRRRTQRLEVTAAEPVAPEEAESTDEELARMRRAITQLPEHLRQTLTLRLTEGLTYEQIAQVLGIPLGTVRSRLHAAVRRLREQMIGTGGK